MRTLLPALFVALLSLVTKAHAGHASFHSDLARATTRIDRARGPSVYAAIRDVWRTWDRADPGHVEEALRGVATDSRLGPGPRAYAALLAAYARGRRGDLSGERTEIAGLGYVNQWLVLGPFDNEGKTGLDTRFDPELALAEPLSEGRTYQGKERAVRWRAAPPEAFPFGWVDFAAMLRPERKICGFAATFVSPAADGPAPRKITLWVGASGAFALRWNGRVALEDRAYRAHDPDRLAVAVALEPGPNLLLVKVCADESPPVLSVRIGDEKGEPRARVTTSTDLSLAPEAARKVRPDDQRERPVPGVPEGPAGPLQAFKKQTAGAGARPSELFEFARYLAATGGDDPTEHLARDLAARAAEAEPNVERLLLAGALGEDRNRRAAWMAKAARFEETHTTSVTDHERVELLLAQASLARESQNWREAFPYYDRVLALDPTNLEALKGRVELYNHIGLRRTALSMIERAVDADPAGVVLLNMYASQLRALGRATEAAEIEERYAHARFDDGGYLSQRIDLALERRDRAAAEHWVSRLLTVDPDGLWAAGTAARAYRRLAQPDRAIAAYERALLLAPEEVSALRAVSDLHAEAGRRERQLDLLKEILRLRPQEKDVREYVEHMVPPKPREDEAHAWSADRFLKMRHADAAGQNRRSLVELTVSTVFENGLSSQFRQVVFQPLTDAAAAEARQYAFQYQADTQQVVLRGARVYRSDGRVDEAIESGEAPANDPSITMYTSGRNFYVQFPRLEPGDVVELRYRVEDVTLRNEFADYFGEVTYLQSSDPTAHAEYVLITPGSRTFHFDVRGLPGIERSEESRDSRKIYRFAAKNVPAVTPEPAMPPWSEVLGHVHVSTYRTWQELGRWYWGLVKDQFDLDDETRKLARKVAGDAKTDLEKVRAVYGWVVKQTRYVALEFGIYGYKPRRCVQTVARGWGDCKDKATVIVSLLEELGVPATIVIVRTQMRGDFNPAVASFAPFDHAIAYVPSLDLYLDGTAEYTGSHELPTMDLGAKALVIDRGNARLVTLPSADPASNLKRRTVTAALSADGKASVDLSYVTRGANAPSWRRRYHAASTLRDRVNQDLGREFPGLVLLPGPQGATTSNLEDIEAPVSIRVRGVAPGFARKEGARLTMNVSLGTRLTPTYASLSKRRLSVVVPPLGTEEDSFHVKLPPGAKIASAPPSASSETKFGSYSVTVEQKPGEVTVTSRLSVSVSRVSPADYADWQRFCADADRAMSHELVVSP